MAAIHLSSGQSDDFHFIITTHKLQHDNFIAIFYSVHPTLHIYTFTYAFSTGPLFFSLSQLRRAAAVSHVNEIFGYLTVSESIHFSLKLITPQMEPKRLKQTKKKKTIYWFMVKQQCWLNLTRVTFKKSCSSFQLISVRDGTYIQLHPLVPLTVLCANIFLNLTAILLFFFILIPFFTLQHWQLLTILV